MLTVNELANRSNVNANVVRYYTRRGLLHPERNPENDYRLYQPGDAHRLKFIQQAKSLGFTLKEIEEILSQIGKGESACPIVRDRLKARIADNRKQIKSLVSLQQRMEQALSEWEFLPNLEPDTQHVCHLIESSGTIEVTNTAGSQRSGSVTGEPL